MHCYITMTILLHATLYVHPIISSQQQYALHTALHKNAPVQELMPLIQHNTPHEQDHEGNTPLHLQVQKKIYSRDWYKITTLLLQSGANPHKNNMYDLSPFDYLCYDKPLPPLATLTLFFDHNASCNTLPNKNGLTPFSYFYNEDARDHYWLFFIYGIDLTNAQVPDPCTNLFQLNAFNKDYKIMVLSRLIALDKAQKIAWDTQHIFWETIKVQKNLTLNDHAILFLHALRTHKENTAYTIFLTSNCTEEIYKLNNLPDYLQQALRLFFGYTLRKKIAQYRHNKKLTNCSVLTQT